MTTIPHKTNACNLLSELIKITYIPMDVEGGTRVGSRQAFIQWNVGPKVVLRSNDTDRMTYLISIKVVGKGKSFTQIAKVALMAVAGICQKFFTVT